VTKGPIVQWILRLILAGVYLAAALPKIADPWSFARSIANFHLLPHAAIPILALGLPMLEAAAALALVTGLLRRGGLLLLTLLSAVFFLAVGSAVVRGLDIDCGCFGSSAHLSAGLGHLAMNAGLVAVGILLMTMRLPSREKR
jgi:uncharacterized membrane protein YphA (DoxX/SURF4 family)